MDNKTLQKMKISSDQIDSRTAIKGSTRRIRELLKPSSYKIRERSLAKNQRTKKSRGLNAAERVDKAHFIRGSLDFKAKNIATTLFRTEEFKNPKRAGAGSFFVQNKVRLSSKLSLECTWARRFTLDWVYRRSHRFQLMRPVRVGPVTRSNQLLGMRTWKNALEGQQLF